MRNLTAVWVALTIVGLLAFSPVLAEPAPDREVFASLNAVDASQGYVVADNVRYPLASTFRVFDVDGNQVHASELKWGAPVSLSIHDGRVFRIDAEPEDPDVEEALGQ
ncbi:MAG: hypothetical protein JJT90_10380 [Ectothiorhodospiraceae bacterium]|nr:hypothetical protein [Ectothiorhodospiraceae bacterium]